MQCGTPCCHSEGVSLIPANPKQGGCSSSARADESCGMSVVQYAGFLWGAGCLGYPPQCTLFPAKLHTALHVCQGLGATGKPEGMAASCLHPCLVVRELRKILLIHFPIPASPPPSFSLGQEYLNSAQNQVMSHLDEEGSWCSCLYLLPVDVREMVRHCHWHDLQMDEKLQGEVQHGHTGAGPWPQR